MAGKKKAEKKMMKEIVKDAAKMASSTNMAVQPKKKKKNWMDKVASGAKTVGGIAETLAPLLALAPAMLARHPDYVGHPALQSHISSAPAAFGGVSATKTRFSSKARGGKMLVSSCDIVDQVKWTPEETEAFAPLGTPLFVFSLDPYSREFSGTRIQQLAKTYQQWRVVSCKVIYVPMAPTSAVGALALMTTTDPDETIGLSGLPALKAVLAHEGATEFPVWMPAGANYSPVKDRVFYSSYLNGPTGELSASTLAGVEARQTSAGQVGIFAASDLYPYSDGTNEFSVWGQVLVDWEIEFSVPVVQSGCDYLTFGKTITATGGAGVSIANPLGTPATDGDGWGNWDDEYPITNYYNYRPKNNLPLRLALGSANEIAGFPSGYYMVYLFGLNLSNTVAASAGPTGSGQISIVTSYYNAGVGWFVSWAIIEVTDGGNFLDQSYSPITFTTAPTGVDVNDMRFFVARFGDMTQHTLPGLALTPAALNRENRRRLLREQMRLRRLLEYDPGTPQSKSVSQTPADALDSALKQEIPDMAQISRLLGIIDKFKESRSSSTTSSVATSP